MGEASFIEVRIDCSKAFIFSAGLSSETRISLSITWISRISSAFLSYKFLWSAVNVSDVMKSNKIALSVECVAVFFKAALY